MKDDSKYTYRNLLLWQKAQELSLGVIKLVAPMPRSTVSDVLARQIIRSASSVAANIAEGHGRFTPAAHSNHLSIAKGSACETDGWLDLLRRSEQITAEQERPLHEACMEIVAMLTAKMRQLDSVRRSSAVRGDHSGYDAEYEAVVDGIESPGSSFQL